MVRPSILASARCTHVLRRAASVGSAVARCRLDRPHWTSHRGPREHLRRPSDTLTEFLETAQHIRERIRDSSLRANTLHDIGSHFDVRDSHLGLRCAANGDNGSRRDRTTFRDHGSSADTRRFTDVIDRHGDRTVDPVSGIEISRIRVDDKRTGPHNYDRCRYCRVGSRFRFHRLGAHRASHVVGVRANPGVCRNSRRWRSTPSPHQCIASRVRSSSVVIHQMCEWSLPVQKASTASAAARHPGRTRRDRRSRYR